MLSSIYLLFYYSRFVFFISRLLQRKAAPVHLPADKENLCKSDIQKVTSEKQRETKGKDRVDTRDKIEYLCRQNSPKRRLIDKIDQMERMTDEKFKAVFDAFRQITGKSQRYKDEQEKLRDEVQKRFNEHGDFIRTNFRI